MINRSVGTLVIKLRTVAQNFGQLATPQVA